MVMKYSKTGQPWTSRAPDWRFRLEDWYSGVEIYPEDKKSETHNRNLQKCAKLWPGIRGPISKFLLLIQNSNCHTNTYNFVALHVETLQPTIISAPLRPKLSPYWCPTWWLFKRWIHTIFIWYWWWWSFWDTFGQSVDSCKYICIYDYNYLIWPHLNWVT